MSGSSWVISAYVALSVFILAKNFVVDVVRVNSNDMRAALNAGEAVLLRKSFYNWSLEDLVYFRYPLIDSSMSRSMMIQRLFAKPGDTIEIKNAEVYVNHMLVGTRQEILQNYFVKSDCEIDSSMQREFQITEGGPLSDKFDYSFSMSVAAAKQLSSLKEIKSVSVRIEKPGTYDENCFPFYPRFVWNQDNFGPLYVPKVNDTLAIDTSNIAIYSLIIREHEKNHLEMRADSIFINGEYTKQYVTKKNYFFVLGDNRGNANDSRNWGYLPENMIRGKVIYKLNR